MYSSSYQITSTVSPEYHIPLPATTKKRVVIVGCGFGGLQLMRSIDTTQFQVVLLDRNNFHSFSPLLYQVATAGLEPDSIIYPIRKLIVGHPDVFFRLCEVQRIDPQASIVYTTIGCIAFDYLVVATGSKTNFFNNTQLQTHGMGMKSVSEALNIRSLVLQHFEQATLATSVEERQRLMNIIVVGGGPTGVETAGAFSELRQHILPHDYPDVNVNDMNIYLVEASGNLLNGLSEISGTRAVQSLRDMNVHVLLNTAVEHYDGTKAILKDMSKEQAPRQTLYAATLIWSAGVMGDTIMGVDATTMPQSIARGNRIYTDCYNRVLQAQGQYFPHIFAIGDVALVQTEEAPNGYPMVAQPAMQQGKLLAQNLTCLVQGTSMTPFRYRDLGSMATIGRSRAVAELLGMKLTGLPAWVIWLFVHVMSLAGFRNRLVVLLNWTWNYFSYDRGTRLIVRPFVKQDKQV